MAATAPGGDAFHIHQVVAAFQMSIVIKQYRKKCNLFSVISAKNNNGINAMKINIVREETGHEAHKNMPDKILKLSGENFFKTGLFSVENTFLYLFS